jgi:hypothetical protein
MMVVVGLVAMPASRSAALSGDAPVSLGSFSGTASAAGVQVNLAIPDYLIVQNFLDGGGPAAQAALDSLGTSQALSSFPYPGETGAAVTGLVGILTGLSLPSYPLLIQSSYPTTVDDRLDQPGYHLSVHSNGSASTSSAELGEGTASGMAQVGLLSTASVTAQADGSLVSEATSKGDFQIGPLKLTGFETLARVVRSPGGTLARSSRISIGKLSLGALSIGLTDAGLVMGNSTMPLNAIGAFSKSISLGPTKLTFVPSTSTGDSVLSAGLELTTSQMVAAIGHPVNVSYLIGRTFAAADSTALPALPASPPLLSVDATTPPGGSEVAGGVIPAAGSNAPLPAASASPGAVALGIPAPRRSNRQAGSPQVEVVGTPLLVSSWTLYPIAVLAGLVVLVAALGSRLRGRLPWSS